MSERKSNLNRREFCKKSLWLGGSVLAGGIFFLKPAREKFLAKLQNEKSPKLFSRQEKIMGTWIAISCYSTDAELANHAIADAFTEIKTIDRLMSIHRPDSQISMINKNSGHRPVQVDPRMTEILLQAQQVSEKVSGQYDVTILPLMKLFGFYGRAPAHIPSDQAIASTLDLISYKNIEIRSSEVGLKKSGAAIDLGSIGKGYAVDRAIQVLKSHGITSALVNAGGNIFALGAPEMSEDPRAQWNIGIRHPNKMGEFLKTVAIRDQGIATSGVDQTFVNIKNQEIGHIFNAVTGKPSHEYSSSTVIVDNATRADILSTTSFIIGPQKSRELFSDAKFEFYHG